MLLQGVNRSLSQTHREHHGCFTRCAPHPARFHPFSMHVASMLHPFSIHFPSMFHPCSIRFPAIPSHINFHALHPLFINCPSLFSMLGCCPLWAPPKSALFLTRRGDGASSRRGAMQKGCACSAHGRHGADSIIPEYI